MQIYVDQSKNISIQCFNLTEILVDFRKFERLLRWKEFWADEEGHPDKSDFTPDVFPKHKTMNN